MTFQVDRVDTEREGMGYYKYRIDRDGQLVAHYWYDHRDYEHGLQYMDGTIEVWSGSHMQDFLESNGPLRLKLSETAVAYLEQNLK